MTAENTIQTIWNSLPIGARAALEQQWLGLAAGGLPCGSSVVDGQGSVIAVGRNHAYDPAGALETRTRYPLQHNRLAHAELNTLALLPTETDHAEFSLWSTQHPCSMCAAAIQFIGMGNVFFIADDPSDDSSPETIAATRGGVPYQALGDPVWWTVSNLLFLYISAVSKGEDAGNLKNNRARYPHLVSLTLDLAKGDQLGHLARSGIPLQAALDRHFAKILAAAQLS